MSDHSTISQSTKNSSRPAPLGSGKNQLNKQKFIHLTIRLHVGAQKQRNIRDNIFVLGAVINSVINGGEAPIQVQVQDAVKCFDKLWLQATTNSLYEAGMTNSMLNLLYLENAKARVAVKVNNRLTKSITVTELQGSVWGSLKCTALMDTLNKIILPQSHMTYKYKGDQNIELGVLGMVDDNLAIGDCGISSVQKNAVINSFCETKKILSQRKQAPAELEDDGTQKC